VVEIIKELLEKIIVSVNIISLFLLGEPSKRYLLRKLKLMWKVYSERNGVPK